MEINTSMDIETSIFANFKSYIKAKSKYNPNVFNKTPQNLSVFPTVILRETNNRNNSNYTTLDRQETVEDITDTIEIYTQDMIIGGTKIPSKVIQTELKFLIFDFFQAYGFDRTQCTQADYMNFNVDRMIIIETCKLASWNRKINI